MNRAVTGSIAVALLLTLLGPAVGAAQTETLNGTWTGTWYAPEGVGPIVLHLTQAGENVRGSYDAGGGPAGPLKGVRVYGTLKGDQLVLGSPSSPRAFEGTVKGSTITGIYWATRSTKRFEVKRSGQQDQQALEK